LGLPEGEEIMKSWEIIFLRFDTIPARDTDGRTDSDRYYPR